MIDPAIITIAGILRLSDPVEIDLEQTHCVAEAVYFEARDQFLDAQIGVASVVLNRGNPCAVINQSNQFSYRTGSSLKVKDRKSWVTAVEVAILVQSGAVKKYNVDHFHDKSITPKWSRNMTKVMSSGNLIFWRKNHDKRY